MKKVVGLMMVVMMVLTAVTTACASPNGYYDMLATIHKWAESRRLYDYTENRDIDGILYGVGVLSEQDFYATAGVEFSVDAFDELSKNTFNMCEIHTYPCGVAIYDDNKYIVYHSVAQSETTALGHKYSESYYCADVLFLVYDENDF